VSKTHIPTRVKIDSLLYRAVLNFKFGPITNCGRGIFCEVCRVAILPGQKIDWDHHLREESGGTTDYLNIRPLHHECHKEKRRVARSKATTLGKDNYEARKTKRLSNGGKKRRGPPMRSRGFSKTHTRHFDRTVTLREPRT